MTEIYLTISVYWYPNIVRYILKLYYCYGTVLKFNTRYIRRAHLYEHGKSYTFLSLVTNQII